MSHAKITPIPTKSAPGPAPGTPLTPLPWAKVIVIAVVLFANQFGSLVIFPFLPFMVSDFFPDVAKDQIGFYAGVLGTAYYLGSFSGSIMWGQLSDKYGRRPVLLCGILGTLLSISLFGFSPVYLWAIATRFSWGFLNGNIGVAKSYLSEVCDDSNMARGFSYIGLSSGLGRLVGPATGAFLSNPVTQYPETFGGNKLLTQFPYVLPCAVGAVVCLTSFCLSFLFLNESLSNVKPLPCMAKASDVERAADKTPPQSWGSWTQGMRDLIQDERVSIAVALYAGTGFFAIIMAEAFPLWILTDRQHGGFSFKAQDIGFVIMCAAPSQIVTQTFMFAPLSGRLGYRRLYQVAAAGYALCCVLLPSFSYFAPDEPNRAPGEYELPMLTWLCVVLTYMGVYSFQVLAFTSVMVLINNSCLGRNRGTVNGIGQTSVALTRMLGPTVGGTLFAWSERPGHVWPFNFYFVFYFVALGMLGMAKLARRLPETIESKRVEH